jgi:hypothetical protein
MLREHCDVPVATPSVCVAHAIIVDVIERPEIASKAFAVSHLNTLSAGPKHRRDDIATRRPSVRTIRRFPTGKGPLWRSKGRNLTICTTTSPQIDKRDGL